MISESDDGGILVHGHDMGERVKQIKGSDDYEYFLAINEEEVFLLKNKLGLKTTKELFNWFEQAYSTERAFSQIRERLKDLGLNPKFSSR